MPQNDINNNQASKALYTSAPFSWQLRLAQGLPLDQADGSRWIAADNPPEVKTDGTESRRVLVMMKDDGYGPYIMIARWYNSGGYDPESMWIIESDGYNYDSDDVIAWMNFPPFQDVGLCEWSCSNPDSNLWNTCWSEWQLTEGTPTENGMKFCPLCGRQLVIKQTNKLTTKDSKTNS